MRKLYKTLRVVLSVTGILLLAACSNASDGPDDASLEVPAKETVATPAFSVASGAVNSGTSVKITCATEGAKIYYTTDGTEPTAKSREYTYAIKITEAVTVKAVAVKSGMNDSTVATASYTIKQTVATPTFSVPAGAVTKGTSITIACTTDGAKIYYTTDGTEPTASSIEYTAAITINRDITVKAIAVKDGMNNSFVSSTSYSNTVPAPTFSVPAGDVENGTSVTISCTTKGAKIYYTIDGTVPTASSTGYTGAISVTSPLTIKAIAVKEAMDDSAVASVSYTIEQIPEGFAKVTGTDVGSFYIAKTELTYAEWYEVYQWAVSNGYVFQDLGREGSDGTDGAAPSANSKQPVTMVSWRDAVVWCNAASEKAGLTPVYEYEGNVLKEAENYSSWGTNTSNTTNVDAGDGKAEKATVKADANGYRLPTEAEWEYAAKGGANYTYSGSDNIDDVAWYNGNSEYKTHDVGTKDANGYELHDMSGNVWEWCQNTVWSGSSNCVFRGGSWIGSADKCAVSNRDYNILYYRFNYYGFRVVRSSSK